MKTRTIPLKEFKNIYSKVPRLCVDLVILNDKNGVLLSKRDIPPDKGWWHFPGGTVLMGETLRETAQRVALEELNIKVKVKKLLGVHEYTKGSGLGYPIAVVFLVEPLGKIVGGKQAKSVSYYTRIPDRILPEVKIFIKKHLTIS